MSRQKNAKKELSQEERLSLIVEAVKYCQKVIPMGMPSNCYSKALREPIFFLWEKWKKGNKYNSAAYRSTASLGLSHNSNLLRYDHSLPFKLVQEKLLNLKEVNTTTVKQILETHLFACVITKQEDNLLTKAGLRSKMPEDWDGIDHLARYKAVGIEVQRNDTKM
jgi:hypothetical protein